jgi:hypothetical protein
MSSLCAGEEQLVGRRVTLAGIHRAANRQAPADLIQYRTHLYQASEGGGEQERDVPGVERVAERIAAMNQSYGEMPGPAEVVDQREEAGRDVGEHRRSLWDGRRGGAAAERRAGSTSVSRRCQVLEAFSRQDVVTGWPRSASHSLRTRCMAGDLKIGSLGSAKSAG